MYAYINGIERTFDFSGRMSRRDFAIFHLVNFVVSVVLSFALMPAMPLGLAIFVIYQLVVLISSASSIVRRLHDMDASGWLALIALIPFLNIWFLIWVSVARGDDSSNRFGEADTQISRTQRDSNEQRSHSE